MVRTTHVLRSFRYRLRPTLAQERRLLFWLRATRELYNAALQERRDAWAKQRARCSYVTQSAQLAAVRAERTDLAEVPIVVLRGALRRLDRAFAAFFRRCKSGEAPGYPRFKGCNRWASVLVDDMGGRSPIVAGGRRVRVPGIGKVKLKMHRPFAGPPEALRIMRDAAGRWFVTLACIDVPARPLPATGRAVGLDLGLLSFVATSDGDTVPNAKPGAEAARLLARKQRRVSRRKRGSTRRRRAVVQLRREHERIANRRRERSILLARALVERYDTICVEKLSIKGLAGGMLARPVHDAAWGDFLHWLRVKAEEAGREVVEVDPRGTSQTCPDCGTVKDKSLSERVHRCDCGLVCDRDVAAARVILGAGLALRGGAPVVVGLPRSAKPELTRAKHVHRVSTF